MLKKYYMTILVWFTISFATASTWLSQISMFCIPNALCAVGVSVVSTVIGGWILYKIGITFDNDEDDNPEG